MCIPVVVSIHATDSRCCLRGKSASTVVGDGDLEIGSRMSRRSSEGVAGQVFTLVLDGLLQTARRVLPTKAAILLLASIALSSISALLVLLFTAYASVDAPTSRIRIHRSLPVLLFWSLASTFLVLDEGSSFMTGVVGSSPFLLLGHAHTDSSSSIDDAFRSTTVVSSHGASLRCTGVELLLEFGWLSGATATGHGVTVFHDDVVESHVELVFAHVCLANTVGVC